jgi:hypothetical protein
METSCTNSRKGRAPTGAAVPASRGVLEGRLGCSPVTGTRSPHSTRRSILRLSRAAFLVATGLLLFGVPRPANAQWRLEAWFGDAWNLHTPVTFSQTGQPDIRVTGHWSTRPWKPTWYYAGRVARWSGDRAWAFEYMHHKIYMDNPPEPEVEAFRITNGVNNLLAERLWRSSGWEYGIGAGPTFVVPISTVRGVKYDHADGIFESRYEFGGGTLQLNLARRLKLLPYTYGSLSIKGTASYLRVRIADGHARLMNYALHFQSGLSLQTAK